MEGNVRILEHRSLGHHLPNRLSHSIVADIHFMFNLLPCIYLSVCLFSADQRNLGMSMKVEKSTLDQVKKRFEFNKKAKEQKEKEYGVSLVLGRLY